jgi:hypothetical protein
VSFFFDRVRPVFSNCFEYLRSRVNHLTRHLFGKMPRLTESLPLLAGQTQRQGETNLGDGGELTGVPVKWIPNQASHGFED